MGFNELLNAIPQILSIFAFFISLLLMFWGLRYFASTKLDDVAQMLAFAIPGLWMMGFALYLWMIGKEDRHE